ncbi:calreticulin-like isoform X2 [Harmonia axyridis]|uniref:calreticulin-like isoform X2 n=1 Tax=Harmonia axyridis TaxID=115357 RepID=UPI001E2764AA|nr:calreticulin-like isoform X2 [Harmonia axyridis]
MREVETTVEEVEKTKAEEAVTEEKKVVEANGDAENGSEEKDDDKEVKEDEEKNGHDESDKCAIKRKSTGDSKEEKTSEEVVPEKKAKIEEAPAEAESNGDAAEVAA